MEQKSPTLNPVPGGRREGPAAPTSRPSSCWGSSRFEPAGGGHARARTRLLPSLPSSCLHFTVAGHFLLTPQRMNGHSPHAGRRQRMLRQQTTRKARITHPGDLARPLIPSLCPLTFPTSPGGSPAQALAPRRRSVSIPSGPVAPPHSPFLFRPAHSDQAEPSGSVLLDHRGPSSVGDLF